jgi:hypothetical protein
MPGGWERPALVSLTAPLPGHTGTNLTILAASTNCMVEPNPPRSGGQLFGAKDTTSDCRENAPSGAGPGHTQATR